MHKGPNILYIRHVLWSDGTKIKVSGQNDHCCIWRKKEDACKPESTILTEVQSGSIMLCNCFSAGGTSALHKIDGLHKEKTLCRNSKASQDISQKLKLGHKWIIQMDNDPMHTGKLVMKWLKNKKVNGLKLPSQSHDLSSIEHLWTELKRHVQERWPTNMAQLHQFCQEKWTKIPAKYCENLLEGTQNIRPQSKFKGNVTKY